MAPGRESADLVRTAQAYSGAPRGVGGGAVMGALRRRRRRHGTSPSVEYRSRRTVIVPLPQAPGSQHRPAPLVLPVAPGAEPWVLPSGDGGALALASFLAVLDVAPAGPGLDVAARSGEHALLAAVYGTRLVRAVEPDPDRAHAARQAAATNALPVVVEERQLVAPGQGNGETLDAYVSRMALQPVVLRLGSGADAAGLLAGGAELLHRLRPWLVLASDRTAGGLLDRVHDLVALGYRLITEADVPGLGRGYVLAPEAAESAFARRLNAWSAALLSARDQVPPDVLPDSLPDAPAAVPAVVDVPVHDDAARTTT